MVSNASELLPEPETPVITVSWLCGISSEMFLRLWTRAPRILMASCTVIGLNFQYTAGKIACFLADTAQHRLSCASYLLILCGDYWQRADGRRLPYIIRPMRALQLTVSLLFLGVSQLPAAPKIDTIQNSASNIVTGPGGPIAQGSIFVIKGSGLGPANISISPTPFQSTTLSGASVAVTVGTTTVNALMYYTSDAQIAALMPSNAPTGSATFTVTYSNQSSPPVSHTVAANDPGIFTVDSSGQGVGIVTYADYSLVSPIKAANCGGPNTTCGAANPGDTLILWATGLGPIAGSDASGSGLGVNMANLPLTVWVGGAQAPVLYQGRSGCCIGEDQIVFTVPNNTATGCAVPLAIQIGNVVSNYVVMPVATSGRTCTTASPIFTTVALQQFAAAGTVSIAELALRRDPNDNGPGFQDFAKLQFFKVTAFAAGSQPFFASYVDDQPVGTCTVYSNTNGNNDVPFTDGVDLNAGSTFTVKGPNGSVNVKPTTLSGAPATLSAAGTFLSPGDYTI